MKRNTDVETDHRRQVRRYGELARPSPPHFETVGDLIGHPRTAAGLRVKAKLEKRRYPTGS